MMNSLEPKNLILLQENARGVLFSKLKLFYVFLPPFVCDCQKYFLWWWWDGGEMDNEGLLVLIKYKKDSNKVGHNAA